MWLWAKRFMWSNKEGEEIKKKVSKLFPNYSKLQPKEIVFEFMYWRKANAIHRWFVEHIQNGVDDCRRYSVSTEQLKELLEIVKKVLDNRDLAKKLLPAQEGFFFGGTEYDEYYLADIEKTIEIVNKCMKDFDESWTFEYHSSW